MNILQGLLTGLSVGVYCIGVCLPMVVPVLLAQRRTLKSAFWVILEFSLGRLIGYMVFGGIFGWLGEKISSNFIHWVVSGGGMLIALLMIFHSLGFWIWGAKSCGLFFKKIKIAFLLGFLTGVNVCPPFLASLSYVFNLKDFLSGVGYFIMFFVGTSLYIVPMGLLASLTESRVFRKIARVSGLAAGLYFLHFAVMRMI